MKRAFMTKKHYDMIANTIRGLHEDHNMAWPDVTLTAEHFANMLETTNALFKRDLFLAACGVNIGTSDTSSSD